MVSLGVFLEMGYFKLDSMVQIFLDLGKVPGRAGKEKGIKYMLVD